MPFVPTVNAIKVSIEGTLAGQLWVLTLQVGKATAVTPADVNNAANSIFSWFAAQMIPALTTATICNAIVARTMANQTDLPVTVAGPGAGTQAVPSLPNGTALVTTFRTNMAGRSGRGRNYLMGLANNSGTSVSPAAGTITAVDAAYTAMNGYLTPFSLFHAVVSLFSNNAPRAAGLINAVTSYTVDDSYDSQRRRLKGRGA